MHINLSISSFRLNHIIFLPNFYFGCRTNKKKMYPELANFWNIFPGDKKIISAIGCGDLNADFLLYHLICLNLRAEKSVVLFCFGENSQHFQTILAKLGLSPQLHQKRLKIFDFFSQIGNDRNRNLAEILDEILLIEFEKNSLIVFDSLTIFLDAGISLKILMKFCVEFRRKFAEKNENSLAVGLQIPRNDPRNDPEDPASKFANFWSQIADWNLIAGQLGSGWSSEVDGELKIFHWDRKNSMRPTKEIRLLFRLGDRTVKFWPPGLMTGTV